MYQQHGQQNFASSEVSPFKDAKNSRILNRKQIERRLIGLKAEQYEKIRENLTQQNYRLQQEVIELHEKVQQLKAAKKIQIAEPNPVIEDEIKSTKKQLELKYEKMNYLKEEIRKTDLKDELKRQLKERSNEIHTLDQELKTLMREKMKQIEIYEKSMEALEEYVPKDEDRDERIGEMSEENKQLRRKINQANILLRFHEKTSQEALGKLYSLKHEEQKFYQVLLENKKNKKSMITEMKSIDYQEVSQMKKEVDELKQRKKLAEKELVNEKVVKEHRKVRLEKEAKDGVEHHKELLRKRMKALNHLNLYEAKDKRQREAAQYKVKKEAMTFEEEAVQTDRLVPKDFRREWIGREAQLPFDDGLVVDYRANVMIRGVALYKTDDHIVFMKFFYEAVNKKKYESKVPLEPGVLRKLECKKILGKGNSYLKNFKVSLTSDKITKVELIWSDGEVCVEGWEIEGSTKFKADISEEERPISMFGSLTLVSKNNYALSSLGCEVGCVD